MNMHMSPVKTISPAPLKNVAAMMTLIETIRSRPQMSSGFGVFSGPSGYGKTVASTPTSAHGSRSPSTGCSIASGASTTEIEPERGPPMAETRASPPDAGRARAIVDVWREVGMDGWFRVDPDFDRSLAERFMDDHLAAARRQHDAWSEFPDGALALLILLDQFPRNAFRGTAHMFATDALALAFARRFLDLRFDEAFEPDLRMFFYLPFTHSERLADQEISLARRRALGKRIERRAAEHLEIIARFGRFPHRNPVLGRETTAAEQAFLDGGGFAG